MPKPAPHPEASPIVTPTPGVTIHHRPAASGTYVGSPSLCVLPDGSYLASHDLFGPKSNEYHRATGRIYQSSDKGLTWKHLTDLDGFFWSNLFVRQGWVYAIGTDKHHGQLVIHRSTDKGRTWTHAVLATGAWHTAPVPMVEHNGRLWRAVEDAMGGTQWGERYRARMMSIPINSDLMNPKNWTFSNPLARDTSWLDGDFAAWLEGNAVIDPKGAMVDFLRVDNSRLPEKAAIVRIREDGKKAEFDPARDFIDFPGGAKKFTIRKDPSGIGYWSLTNIIPEDPGTANRDSNPSNKPAAVRNTLALVYSKDLRNWQTRCILIRHPDANKHGLQYVDWQFDGKDLIAVCRTAWDDENGGAENFHDANFLTFHRWPDFRQLDRKNDAPLLQD